MLVTPLGIEIETSEVQPKKAESTILVTPLGIVTEVNEVQPEKA